MSRPAKKGGRVTHSPICPMRAQMRDPDERRHQWMRADGDHTICRLCGTEKGQPAKSIELTGIAQLRKELRWKFGVRGRRRRRS